jgi:predicted outer membrane repeat protein
VDAARFQKLITCLIDSGTRREIVRGGLAALGLSALGLASLPDETEARKKSRRQKRSRRNRRRKRNGGNLPGTGGNGGNNSGNSAGSDNPPGDFRATPCTRVCAAGCDFTSVQAAIDAASDGDTLTICSGQFNEDITITKNLTLAAVTGGEIILEGTGTRSVLTVPETENIVNVTLSHVVIGKGIGTLVEGVRLGGGIYFDNAGALNLVGCEVAVSTADDGGGIYCLTGQNLTLIDTTVNNNQATQGGGIFATGRVQLDGSAITDNTAERGGGIYSQIELHLSNGAKVEGNTATGDGGGIYNDANSISIDRSFVANNTAGGNGGGIYNRISGRLALNNGATIEQNEAQNGGGIYNDSLARLTSTDSAVSRNKADQLGGGIFNDDGVVTLQSTTIFRNTAVEIGGGIFNTDGGTVTVDAGSAVVDNTPNNCTGTSACPA